MALFPNAEQTLFKDWPKETQEAFLEYYKGGGKCYHRDDRWKPRTWGIKDYGPHPDTAYTDDPDAEVIIDYSQAFHSARITPEFRGKPSAEATAPQPTGVANPNRLLLGDMSEADRLAIAKAWACDEMVWVTIDGRWVSNDFKSLFYDMAYTTIDPTKPIPEVQYPWEWLPDWVEWCAVDENGDIRGFNKKPERRERIWSNAGSEWATLTLTINTHGLHWTKTLVRRPAGL